MATQQSKAPTIIRVIKNRENPYAMINRSVMEDDRLSLEARGLMGYLLVKPDDWQVWNTDLARTGKMGRYKMDRILNELKTLGYMRRVRKNNAAGHIVWETHIFESPQEPLSDYPTMVEPTMADPLMVNPTIYQVSTVPNTNGTNKERETAAPASEPVDMPRNSPVSSNRDMAIAPGTPVNRRPDAPPVRAVPKPSDDPTIAALLDELRPIYPFRDGKCARPALAKRALAGLTPAERAQVKMAAGNYAASRDGLEGYAQDLHTWIEGEAWREYLTPATPRPLRLVSNGSPVPAPAPALPRLDRAYLQAQKGR